VFLVFFNNPVVTPAQGLLELSLRFIPKNVRLLALYICATNQSPGLFTLGLVTVHIFSFYVWPFAFMWQVT